MTTSNYEQVDRRSNLSVSDFKKDYLRGNKPVVITDAIKDWSDKRTWSFDYFAEDCGDIEVKIFRYDRDEEFTDDNVTMMKLAEFINGVREADWLTYPYYLRDNWTLFHEHPKLRDDHSVPPYFFDWFKFFPPFLRMPYPRIFIGPKGAVTPIHMDVWRTHAWLSQLSGRKRWLLYPPEQEHLLYDYDVRVEAPDLERHPRYAETTPLEAVIGPGDTIYAPSGWAHWVESLDPTISITYNFMARGCFGPCISNTLKTVSVGRLARYVGKRLGTRPAQA